MCCQAFVLAILAKGKQFAPLYPTTAGMNNFSHPRSTKCVLFIYLLEARGC